MKYSFCTDLPYPGRLSFVDFCKVCHVEEYFAVLEMYLQPFPFLQNKLPGTKKKYQNMTTLSKYFFITFYTFILLLQMLFFIASQYINKVKNLFK